MAAAVNRSIDATRRIEDHDYALMVLARQQAAQINALHAFSTPAVRGQAVRARGHRLRSLQTRVGTPVVRRQYELRSRRLEAAAAKVAGWQGAPVSHSKRPARRK